MSRMLPFAYYGGKFRHLDFLLPLFPTDGIDHFVDVFGGSASVILNLKKPYFMETYNDIDSQVCNFFQVLRDVPDLFIKKLELTPYSREEFIKAYETDISELDPIERARVFWVKIGQGNRGRLDPEHPENMWSYQKTRNSGKRVQIILNKIAGLADVAARFSTISIENLPASRIIEKYDTEATLFYCDPPYVSNTRNTRFGYTHDMTEDDHRDLYDALSKSTAKVVLSGYENDLYAELYKDWHIIKDKEKLSPASMGTRKVQECAWMNFDPPNRQLEMFEE